MKTTSFRFVNDYLNKRLQEKAFLTKTDIVISIENNTIVYLKSNQEIVDEIINEIRYFAFFDWQILVVPEESLDLHRNYMRKCNVEFHEEMHDKEVVFLIDGKLRPHRWKIYPEDKK